MNSFRISKLSDLETLLPGFSKVWPTVKASCGTRQRNPKRVSFTDKARPVCANDYDCAKRFSLNLETMNIEGSVHVSCGEWASSNRGQEEEVEGIPGNMALLTCTYNDYYRTFTMEVQVAPGNIPQQLPKNVEGV